MNLSKENFKLIVDKNLIDRDDLEIKDTEGRNFLYWLCMNDHVDFLRLLFEKRIITKEDFYFTDNRGRNILEIILIYKSLSIFEYIFKSSNLR